MNTTQQKQSYVDVIIAKCHGEYHGRSNKALSQAIRIIIIKEDNTLIIHDTTGLSPTAYLKGTTMLSYQKENHKMTIQAKSKQQETLKITIDTTVKHTRTTTQEN